MYSQKEQIKFYVEGLQKMYPDEYQLSVILDLLKQNAPKNTLLEAVDSLIYKQKLIPVTWTLTQERMKLEQFQTLLINLQLADKVTSIVN